MSEWEKAVANRAVSVSSIATEVESIGSNSLVFWWTSTNLKYTCVTAVVKQLYGPYLVSGVPRSAAVSHPGIGNSSWQEVGRSIFPVQELESRAQSSTSLHRGLQLTRKDVESYFEGYIENHSDTRECSALPITEGMGTGSSASKARMISTNAIDFYLRGP
jgi:hypothetical protein